MPTIEKPLEQRVTDLETLFFDLPNLMNLRLGKFDAQFAELGGRMTALENSQAMLLRDVRDLRGGVTAQLRAQDERLRKQDEQLRKQDERLAQIETRLGNVEAKQDEHNKRLGRIEAAQAEHGQHFLRIESKLDRLIATLGGR